MTKNGMFRVEDFNQGEIGHNYILAYLSQLSQHKERVQKIIVTKEVNQACIYRVKFFINGLRTSVIVHDYLPFNQST